MPNFELAWPTSKKFWLTAGGVAAGVALFAYLRRQYGLAGKVRRISKLPSELEALDGVDTTVLYLERLLHDLERLKQSKSNDSTIRDRCELIKSIIVRLKSAKSDFDKLRSNDFGTPETATEEIARTVWYSTQTPRAGTLSVLSDDTFVSAVEDFVSSTSNLAELDSNSISIDFAELAFYRQALKMARNGDIKVRKLRTEFCGCDSDDDFLAKVYCIRQAFTRILEDERVRQWMINEGRVIFAELMRHDSKDPSDFYIAYDKLMKYVNDPSNYDKTKRELEMRRVEEVNLWDILFDFVLLDSFDDLRKPPSSVVALFRNNFFSRSFKESTLNSLIWSMIKMKRQKLLESDGFISHFYDISQVISPMLIFAFFGDGSKAFSELCIYFKESVYSFVCDIFNLQKVRYTNIEEMSEDVKRLLEVRLENMQVKISNELISG